MKHRSVFVGIAAMLAPFAPLALIALVAVAGAQLTGCAAVANVPNAEPVAAAACSAPGADAPAVSDRCYAERMVVLYQRWGEHQYPFRSAARHDQTQLSPPR